MELAYAQSSERRYKQLSRTLADLNKAVDLGKQVLDLCPLGHPNRSMFLNNAAIRYSVRYQSLGEMTDLNEAITLGLQALNLCSPANRNRSMYLNNAASYLSDRYKWSGEVADLSQAIVLAQRALDISPPGDPSRAVCLHSVAIHLSDRYKRLGEMTDLDEAIVLAQQALDISPPGHPSRSVYLNSVASYLSHRYKQLGERIDLNGAVVLGRQAFDIIPPHHSNYPVYLNNVAIYLSNRYEWSGEISDLEEAITLAQTAMDITPSWRPNRSMYLNTVATCLSNRYQRLGEMVDLNKSIVLGRQALDLRPPGHTDRAVTLNVVANCLFYRYQQLGEMEDLDEAVMLGNQALEISSPGHPDRSMYLSCVALYLSNRYRWLGKMADMNRAFILGRETLDVSPVGHPRRSFFLANIATCLSERYDWFRDLMDLNEAILLGNQALDLCKSENPDYARASDIVANCYSRRYQQLEDLADLDEAIAFGKRALRICLPGHPHRSMYMNGLATYFSDRHKQLGELTDLNKAIVLERQALDISRPVYLNHSMYLTNVAMYLSDRYKLFEETADLNEAIVLGQTALSLRPPGHPDRSKSLDLLATCLHIRFTRTRSNESKDNEDAFGLYTELAHAPQIISSSDIFSSKKWASMAEEYHHHTTILAYKTSLRVLTRHLATFPPLPQHLQSFKDLASSLAVDAFSACLRGQDEKTAVELLEQGRGVFWDQASRLRSLLDDVIGAGPTGKHLADEFTGLASHIHDAMDGYGSSLYQRDRLYRLMVDLETVITDIRKLPGLARFLLPSLFPDLQHAARDGLVIILNASKYTCDALVVFFDRDPVRIPLHITKRRVQEMSSKLLSLIPKVRVMDVKNDLAHFLRALWNEVVSPIVDFLLTIVPVRSRIWWCPTAEFTHLPLHAADPFRKGQRNLSLIYISSYTPTLTALVRARRTDSRVETSIQEKHCLAVGQANISGDEQLLVDNELTIVGEHMQGLATFTRLEGPEAFTARVSEELRKNEWVHFAYHGIPSKRAPFESALALHDGRFTIERIVGIGFQNTAEFAYLSAGHTMVGDEEGLDEAINLVAAFQFTGFRSVIGTMWDVDDAETGKITSKFYENMVNVSGHLDHTRAAFALNKTMNSLVGIPLDQRVLYVHVGA